ncbi:MAG: head GIN domain-containing protein [Chloroflexota bacterium]
MKKIIITMTLVAVLVVSLLPGCSMVGKGTVTEEKKFADFTRVYLGGSFEVEITQADSFSIVVTTRSDLLDYIIVSQEGEILRVYLNPRNPFTDFTAISKSFKAKITMPVLTELRVSGIADVTVKGFKSANNFNLEESGASSLDIGKMEAGDTEFKISGASKLSGDLKAAGAKFEVSGASIIELDGSTENLVLSASGASKASLANFSTNATSVNLSGDSEATIFVKEKLDVVLTDASRLYFKGNPTMGTTIISDASTIKHQ